MHIGQTVTVPPDAISLAEARRWPPALCALVIGAVSAALWTGIILAVQAI